MTGEKFEREVLAAYESSAGGLGDHAADRLDYLQVLREFGGIKYSISQNDQEELTESIRKVLKAGVFSG